MSRLAGTLGAVYVSIAGVFTKVADIYDWEQKTSTHMLRCDIKSDPTERWVPSHGEGLTFTAKRRNEGTTVFPAYVTDAANNRTYTTWRLDLIDNNASFVQITCSGYAKSSGINAPQEGVDETFELQIDDVLTFSH